MLGLWLVDGIDSRGGRRAGDSSSAFTRGAGFGIIISNIERQENRPVLSEVEGPGVIVCRRVPGMTESRRNRVRCATAPRST